MYINEAQQREQFEAYQCRENGYRPRDLNRNPKRPEQYANDEIQLEWQGWCGATEQMKPLVKALRVLFEAEDERNRYYDGKGSYDGTVEKGNYRKAMYAVRQALATIEQEEKKNG